MKKLIAIIISALVLCSMLSLAATAFAAHGSEPDTATETETETEAEDAVNGTDEADTPMDSEENGTADEVGAEDGKNPFEAVFETVKEHSDTIFSALTLIGSLVLAFTYKKGLLPALGASIGQIGDSVKKISDATEMSIVKSEGAIVDIDERIRDIGGLFERLEERMKDLNDKLAAVEEERERGETTRVLMRSQVDMLYDIFMTSTLPQYSKDAVGEKIAAMKKLIEKGED